MNIKKLNTDAVVPTKGSPDAAGYDLYTTESYELKIGERKAFKTNISLAIPPGLYGRIAPRSGLASKKGIDVLAGVIDSDYRGEILVLLINLGQENVTINHGDKIAQIIFEQYTNHGFVEVDDLTATDRGNGGFGSTDAANKVVPKIVQTALTEIFNKTHSNDIAPQIKYSDLMKEREKKI